MRIARLWWLLTLTALLTAPDGALAGTDTDSGAARVETYLKGLNALQARFEQYTFNAERTRMKNTRGTFSLQRPGRFRWEYEAPERQIVVADGQRVYVHDLELQQVSHQSQAKALRGTPALLLADTAPLDRHFSVRAIPSEDGRDWVELIPRDPESEVVRIELGFGAADRLDSLIMEDSFGQTTRLNFTDAVRNPRLDPGLFKIDQRALDDLLSFD